MALKSDSIFIFLIIFFGLSNDLSTMLNSSGIYLYAWMVVSVVVELGILLGMLLLLNCHQLKEFGQVFWMAWMEEFFKENPLLVSFSILSWEG